MLLPQMSGATRRPRNLFSPSDSISVMMAPSDVLVAGCVVFLWAPVFASAFVASELGGRQ